MLERLFKNKKYLFLYLISGFAGFCNFSGVYPSFSCSLFGAFAEEKIPAVVMVIITTLIQGFFFGTEAVLRFLLFVLLFAIFKSVRKEKEKDEKKRIKTIAVTSILSAVITEVLLVLIKIVPITSLGISLLHILFTGLFLLVFDRAFKYLSSIDKNSKDEITTVNSISCILMIVAVTLCLANVKVFGVDLWSLICIVLIMLYSWKNKIIRAVICALLVLVVIALCYELKLEMAICLLAVSLITALISRAGKKGAMLGLAFSTILAIFTIFNTATPHSPEVELKLSEDYQRFLQKQLEMLENEKSGDDYLKISDELTKIEEMKQLNEEAKNTYSSRVIKIMAVGFLMFLLIPEALIERLKVHVELKDEFKKLREKLLKVHKIYRLNAGK